MDFPKNKTLSKNKSGTKHIVSKAISKNSIINSRKPATKLNNYNQSTITSGPIDMILINGGSFEMGGGKESDDTPIHKVSVSGFYMSKYETTQKQWRDIMGSNPSSHKTCDNCPVEEVSWEDIQEFLKQLNEKYPGHSYRLPTEAEWEYAAKGGKYGKAYDWAGASTEVDLLSFAWFSDNSKRNTHPVGSKLPNELGLYDMSGNVMEWCSDWYDNSYYDSMQSINPKGPQSGDRRVLRGGCYYFEAEYCRSAHRGNGAPGCRRNLIGFRLVSIK